MKSLVVLLLGLLTGASALCAAQDQGEQSNFKESGNDFLRICDDANAGFFVHGACLGYVNGVVDGIHGAYALSNAAANKPVESGQPFCFRPDVTMGQKLRVVIQFLKTHPDRTDEPMDLLVFEATVGAFHCPKSSK